MAAIVLRDGSKHIPSTFDLQGGTATVDFTSSGASEVLVTLPTVNFTVDAFFMAKLIDRTDPEQAILLNETMKISPVSISAGVLTVKVYSIDAVRIYGSYEFVWRIL